MTATGTSTVQGRLPEGLRDELGARRLFVSLNASVILFVFEAMFALSFAALIFTDDLSDLLPFVLGSVLIGAAAMVGISALTNSYGGALPVVQDAPSVVLGIAAASVVSESAAATTDHALPTIALLLAGTTVVTGITFLVLGAFRLGFLVRFLPYPVLGGFLAATGWLLLVGGIRVTTDAPLDASLLDGPVLWRWVPALTLGVVGLIAVRRSANPLVLPLLSVLALASFYAVAAVAGISVDELSADGWLLGPFPDTVAMAAPIDPDMLGRVDWSALAGALPLAIPAVLLSVIGLLLNSSSFELVVRRDLRLDRELVATGGANVASGLLGGLPGYTGLSISALSHALGQGRRLPGLLVAVLLVLTWVVGMELLAIVPRVVLGGLLAFVGLSLLLQWTIGSRSTLSRTDRLVVLTVLAVVAVAGMVLGIVVGLVLTVVLFVASYSRVGPIRFEVDGSAIHSRVDRSPRQAESIRAHGSELLVLALQGFVFFGTAHQLIERIRRELANDRHRRLRAVLVDFDRVSGLDSTALMGIQRLERSLRDHGVELALTGLDPRIARRLEAGGIDGMMDGVRSFADLDRGLEWAEDLLLRAYPGDSSGPDLEAELIAVLGEGEASRVRALLARMRRVEVPAGEVVIHQGDQADALYLIESGQLTVTLDRAGRDALRLRTLQPGRLVGEIGFFLGSSRVANVVADRASVLRVLSRADWETLLRSDPEIGLVLHRLTIETLGTRVVELHGTIDALLR